MDVTTLVPPTLIHVGETDAADGTFEGEVRYNNYTARCVLAEPANVNAFLSVFIEMKALEREILYRVHCINCIECNGFLIWHS